jgi:hypothetical protein
MWAQERRITSALEPWLWRFCYLIPIVLTPLYIQFEKGIAATLERTRFEWGLLPFPCLLLRDSITVWRYTPVLCIAFFLLSIILPRLACSEAIAVWFAGRFVFLALHLFWTYLIVATFLR